MNNEPVFVIDGCRTPFLRASGRANPFSAADLAVAAGRPLLLRQPFPASAIEEVILGNVMPAPDEANIARIAALRLGCPVETPAWTVHRNCASGMQALDTAIRNIQGGHAGLILAGGVEAMSRAPLQWRQELTDWLVGWGKARGMRARLRHLGLLKPRFLQPVITLLKGLTDPMEGISMGQTAENLAHRFQISREVMDHFAVESHHRLAKAWDGERFKAEVAPIFDRQGQVYEQDQGLRRDASVERLQGLKPVFDRPTGLLTAGNSAQITDGACWLLLGNAKTVLRYGISPLGRLSSAAWAGLEPAQMGLGPVHAIQRLLKGHGLDLPAVDYWEINEAFAAQVVACTAAMADENYCRTELNAEAPLGRIDPDRLNVDGGAISIGHPVGASGARVILHLLHLLRHNNAKRGVAALCIGGGQGGAMLAETA